MDLAPAPVAVDAVRALADRGDFGYNFAAAAQLPEAFSEWEATHHGWRPDPEQARVFCDVMQAVETFIWVHTEPGDGVVLFTPVYFPFFPAITSTGRRIVECPLDPDGWRIDPERLASVIDGGTKAILLCNPHNPTGRVLDSEELAAIAEVAEKHDLLIISDEIWGDLTHPGAKHIPIASLSEATAARTVTSRQRARRSTSPGSTAQSRTSGTRAWPMSYSGCRACCSATWDRPAPRQRSLRGLPASRGCARCARISPRSAITWPPGLLPSCRAVGFDTPQATYLAWLDFRAHDLGDDPAKTLLETARVALSSGLDFGEAGAGFARLNFATSRELLDEIVDRIVAAVPDQSRRLSHRRVLAQPAGDSFRITAWVCSRYGTLMRIGCNGSQADRFLPRR